jgi:carboxyl-terminal processing protease
MSKKLVLVALSAIIISGLTFVGALFMGSQYSANASNKDIYKQLNLFGDVFKRVRAEYVEKPDEQKLIDAALSGMLTSLDPHSSYMNGESYKELRVQTQGEFGGLGIQVTMEKGLVKVISPMDGTPAHKAGVLSGDLISHIDGDPILGLTLSQAVNLAPI